MMILPLFGSGISLLVDWIWFAEEGFGVIYRTTLKAKIAMSGWASLGFFLFAGVNILIARSVSRLRRMLRPSSTRWPKHST